MLMEKSMEMTDSQYGHSTTTSWANVTPEHKDRFRKMGDPRSNPYGYTPRDMMIAMGSDYNLLNDNCIDGTNRVMKLPEIWEGPADKWRGRRSPVNETGNYFGFLGIAPPRPDNYTTDCTGTKFTLPDADKPVNGTPQLNAIFLSPIALLIANIHALAAYIKATK